MQKKQALIDAATKLFAQDGFDATTTASIGQLASVTEPLIHYHFKNKDGLFTYIIETIFTEYFNRFDALPENTSTQFEKLENLIRFKFQFSEDLPDEAYILVTACPAKLQEAAHICSESVDDQRKRLSRYIAACLEDGIQSGEFCQVPVEATTGLILAIINGLMRRISLKLGHTDGLMETTVEFCRRSLIHK